MERLTRRDEFGNADIIGVDSMALQGDLAFDEFSLVTLALNRLAAYEDTGLSPEEIPALKATLEQVKKEAIPLLEAKVQGRLLVLPCKVGDTIYRSGDPIKKVYEWELVQIEVYHDEIVFIDDSDNQFIMDDIGKTVFLTREEAEAALDRTKEEKENV